MSTSVEDLTIAYTEDGIETIKELDKIVLTKGVWCTILYKFQAWNQSKQTYNPVSYGIRRYQKRNGEYQLRTKFNISSNDQAKKIVDALNHWMVEE